MIITKRDDEIIKSKKSIYSVFSRFSGIHDVVFIVTFPRMQDAKLAVNCSMAFVDFIWSTYECKKRDKNVTFLHGVKMRTEPNEAGGDTVIFE